MFKEDNLTAAIEIARKMRAAQKAYFKTRSQAALIESKQHEKAFDQMLEELDKPGLDL